MFKKLAADALGLSDIGQIIDKKDFDKVDSDDYVMHEDQEQIYFVIKSKKDEYCFTNLALIHLDGDSAVSSKRMLKRYPYDKYEISNVYLETAGTVDLDVEIKFTMGGVAFSIDINKKQLEQVKDLYKALIKIVEITASNEVLLDYAHQSVTIARDATARFGVQGAAPSEQFNAINESAYNWLKSKRKELKVKDFGAVFEKYINQ
ncbi:PH domain-containing protein [Paenibacillus chartarius]|uniref:PH domain-containing protein n=1 Tax=Paenibacillus chartarius TaxID=747481 RepID=A0ABV6DJS7_9BACL